MTLLVDASVRSLALRRDQDATAAIDALLAQLCIRHGLTLLTTDKDFAHAALHCRLKVWK